MPTLNKRWGLPVNCLLSDPLWNENLLIFLRYIHCKNLPNLFVLFVHVIVAKFSSFDKKSEI